MAVLALSSIGASLIAGGGTTKPTTQKFGDVLKAAMPRSPAPQHAVKAPSAQGVAAPAQRPAARAIDQVSAAQTRMDRVLELAQSGKTFSPAELLALQTQMYRASQELDLAGKVVEKATGGVKQVLQTQV